MIITELKRICEHRRVDSQKFELLAARDSIWFHGSSPLELLNDSAAASAAPACNEM